MQDAAKCIMGVKSRLNSEFYYNNCQDNQQISLPIPTSSTIFAKLTLHLVNIIFWCFNSLKIVIILKFYLNNCFYFLIANNIQVEYDKLLSEEPYV